MAETSSLDFLKTRNASAIAAVSTELKDDSTFQLVSAGDIASPLKFSLMVLRTYIHALEQKWTVDIGLPKYFPDDPPVVFVHEWEKLFLENPHVLKGGYLCIIPNYAAIDSSNPVGLVRYVRDKAKEILDGTDMNDFREEFSYYWSLCATDNSQRILIIDPIEKLGKTFAVVFSDKLVCVASTIEKLNNWISNYIGKKSDFTKAELVGFAIHMNAPLLPSDYPRTIADLISLAKVNDTSAAEIIDNHILTKFSQSLALLIQEEGGSATLGGVIFRGMYSLKFSKGFRTDKVPVEILRSRMEPHMNSTDIVRAKVSRVDYRWIHSRGGDGHDFSNKSVLLIGCGSLGGYTAHLLSRSGVGRLTITDNDQFGWENLGRHILGASSVGCWKAESLAETLKRELTHISITGIPKDWRDVFETNSNLFNEHDLIISTVADWRCEGPLNELSRKTKMPPVLFGWLEPYAVAGHCLTVCQNGGCFKCSSNEFGQFDKPVANFQGKTICKEPGGCTHYQRYGPTALMPVASMIASIALEAFLNPPQESFLCTWISSAKHLELAGATLTEFWKKEVSSASYSHIFQIPWNSSNSCPLCNSRNL